jgi:hypothetical protein
LSFKLSSTRRSEDARDNNDDDDQDDNDDDGGGDDDFDTGDGVDNDEDDDGGDDDVFGSVLVFTLLSILLFIVFISRHQSGDDRVMVFFVCVIHVYHNRSRFARSFRSSSDDDHPARQYSISSLFIDQQYSYLVL